MNAHDIIVIGTSASGLADLKELLQALPSDLNATIFIVRHIEPSRECILPTLLQKSSQLKVTQAVHGEKFERSHIYVARPDHHLMLEEGRIILSTGPKENRTRPAIDPLFRSAALAFRSRVIGVVLTGELDDGTAGLWSVKHRGGIAIVQDPKEASSPGMPRSAQKHVQIDHCLPVAEIGLLLAQLAQEPVSEEQETPDDEMEIENRIALEDPQALHDIDKIGKLTHFRCPECRSVLREIRNGTFIRFRCRSGHANTGENLTVAQSKITEDLLRTALAETGENPHLSHYLSEYAREEGDQRTAEFFLSQAAEKERRAHLIKEALDGRDKPEIGRLWELEGRDLECKRLLLQNVE